MDRRLHPASLPLHVLADLKRWSVPLILLLVFSRGEWWEIGLILTIVPNTLYEALHYWRLRWRIDRDELVVHEGVFTHVERHVPFERIQNIDVVQGPLERLLGLAQVRVETAAGSEPEATLRSIRLREVEEMRARVFAGRDEDTSARREEEPELARAGPRTASLVRLGLPEIVGLGIASQRGFAVVLSLLWFGRETGSFRTLSPNAFAPLVALLPEPRWLAVAAILLALAILVAAVFSVGWAVLVFHGFDLSLAGDDVRWSAGLLTRRSATIPRARIQLVSIQAGMLQRLFGAASIRIETAGGTEQEGETRLARRWFVPWLPAERVSAVLHRLDPTLVPDHVDWQPPGPGFRKRMLRIPIVASLLLLGLGLVMAHPWRILAFALVPVPIVLALLEARNLAWARTADGLAFRSGALRLRRTFVRHGRIQSVSVKESPFDRRCGMASLAVDTAGAGPAEHRIRIPYLPRERAAALAADSAGAAEAYGFRW